MTKSYSNKHNDNYDSVNDFKHRVTKHNSYDNYHKPKSSMIKKIIKKVHNYRQSKMIIPTDPIEIKRRANMIRREIELQRQQRLELAELNKDLELIKFHARIKGKLEYNKEDYQDQRDKQDAKDTDEYDQYLKDYYN